VLNDSDWRIILNLVVIGSGTDRLHFGDLPVLFLIGQGAASKEKSTIHFATRILNVSMHSEFKISRFERSIRFCQDYILDGLVITEAFICEFRGNITLTLPAPSIRNYPMRTIGLERVVGVRMLPIGGLTVHKIGTMCKTCKFHVI